MPEATFIESGYNKKIKLELFFLHNINTPTVVWSLVHTQ